jgi:hypothetical protein
MKNQSKTSQKTTAATFCKQNIFKKFYHFNQIKYKIVGSEVLTVVTRKKGCNALQSGRHFPLMMAVCPQKH